MKEINDALIDMTNELRGIVNDAYPKIRIFSPFIDILFPKGFKIPWQNTRRLIDNSCKSFINEHTAFYLR